MKRKPLVSVIIPFGRQDAQFLFRTITSLTNQDYKNIEVILADYSDSTSFGKFDNVSCPIRHIKITRKKNHAGAANKGAKRSKGKILLFCAANAYYRPNYISSLHKKLGRADLIYSWFSQLNISKGGVTVIKTPTWKALNFKRDRDFGPQSIMIKRKKFLWFDIKLRRFNNWDFILNLKDKGRKGVVLPEPLYDYYYTPIAYDLTQSMSRSIARKYAKKSEDFDGIAVIVENQSNFSGGRYHTWMHAVMLAEAGYKVRIYTNRLPVFKDDFLFYKSPEIELVGNLSTLDVKAKLYYGSPFLGTYVGMKLAKKYRKKVICQIFDPPHWLEKMVPKDELPSEMIGPVQMRKDIKTLRMGKQAYVSVSTESARKGTAKWFEIPEKQVLVLPPYVNGRALRALDFGEDKKWILSISRSVARKSWGESLQVFKKAGLVRRGFEMHIITDDPTDIERKATEMGLAEYLRFHVEISDLEKFCITNYSQAILSTSRFEGYGMWAIEGEETDVPVICYSLPPIKEIKKKVGKNTRILTAKVGDIDRLVKHLKRATDDKLCHDIGGIRPRGLSFEMDYNLDVLRGVAEKLL